MSAPAAPAASPLAAFLSTRRGIVAAVAAVVGLLLIILAVKPDTDVSSRQGVATAAAASSPSHTGGTRNPQAASSTLSDAVLAKLDQQSVDIAALRDALQEFTAVQMPSGGAPAAVPSVRPQPAAGGSAGTPAGAAASAAGELVNNWPLHVHVVRGSAIDFSSVPSVTATNSLTKPSTPIAPGAPAHIESHQVLLTGRILRGLRAANAAASSSGSGADSSPAVTIDVGCNAGTYANYWATLGFPAYCVDVEVLGGPSGIGAYSFGALKNAQAIAPLLTFFAVGIAPRSGGYLVYGGHGHEYTFTDKLEGVAGVAVRTATFADIMGAAVQRVFLTKIDIDGGEAGALQSIVNAMRDHGRRVSNIIVEITPMWWRNFGVAWADGWAAIEALTATHDVYVVYWREASEICCRDPFSTPADMDWESPSTPLGFVQKFASAATLKKFIASMLPPDQAVPETAATARSVRQRDFWFRERAQPALPGLADGVDLHPLRCGDPSLYADASKPDMPCGYHHEASRALRQTAGALLDSLLG